MSGTKHISKQTQKPLEVTLIIRDGDNPLDMTAVHPESYAVVEQIAATLGTNVSDLIQKPELVERVNRSVLTAGQYTLDDILTELRKPGRDPRDQFVAPQFREEVREISDVQAGMVLEGVVTNVTKFGAFVDIGVHQDGLVHISELSNKFIKDPAEAVKTGQIVKVKVLSVDAKTMRIGLSMKALMGPRPAQKAQQEKKSGPAPPVSFHDKLAALSTKWGGK